MREWMRRVLAVVVTASGTVASAQVVVLLLVIIGATCAVVGVFLLAGIPWALLTSAAMCLALAFIISQGLDPNV
jgi:hypothetical protein